MFTKFVPLTTRPLSTSRHGMMRLRCTGRPGSAVQGRLALGDRELALVQRLADDHAAQVHLPQRGQVDEVLELADAARVDEAAAHDPGDALDLIEVRPAEQAVLVNVRVD